MFKLYNDGLTSDVSVMFLLVGHGGFGRVALCKNKLDGRQYAVKKIRLKDRSPLNEKILRSYICASLLLFN